MKIIKLTAENVKRLKAVEITPEGNLVVIGGKNNQGKTSVLDSIAMAFAGKKAIPSKPVRKGTEKATVICETEDLIVTRTMTAKGGGSLKVGTKDGKIYQSPQTILDALAGQLTFDPLAFSRMPQKKQVETVKELVGLDFTEVEAKRAQLYAERTDLNREEKKLLGHLESMPEQLDVPDEIISVTELMKELQKRREINSENSNHRNQLRQISQDQLRIDNQVVVIEKQIKKLEDELSITKNSQSLITNEFIAQQKIVDELEDADESEIQEKITGAEEINSKIRNNQTRKDLEQEISELKSQSQVLTSELAKIDAEKSEKLSKAKFPIEGLGFDESTVTFNDIPFDQLSSSEQLKVSTAMGFAMNPKLKILLIRDGSLLDEDNLKILTEMAQKEDSQIWLERVGEGQEVSVIIEDGSVQDAKNS